MNLIAMSYKSPWGKIYTITVFRKIIILKCTTNIFQVCNWPHAVDCNRPETQTTETPTVEPLTDFPSTSDGTTSSPHVTESATSIKSTESTGVPDITVVTPSPDYQCPSDPNVSLLLPHETDCSKFYVCTNGGKILMSCASGTLFDYKTQVNITKSITIRSARHWNCESKTL